MSSLQPYTAKNLALALRAAGLSVQASAEVDADDLTDAAVELANDISVQICDYAKRDGGLTYIAHRALREDGEITAMQDLGSAKCLPALIDLLRPLFPVVRTCVPRGRTAVTLRSPSLSFTDRLVHRRTCRSRSSRVPPPRLCHAHLVALPIRPPSATARFALKRVAALVPDGQRQRCRTALPLDGARALLSIAGSLLLEVPMSSLLPTFRVAYIVRDAQGVSRGGAVQLRAANADAAGRAARAMRRDVVSFEIVAVAAL